MDESERVEIWDILLPLNIRESGDMGNISQILKAMFPLASYSHIP
jgi:hypothetical protein